MGGTTHRICRKMVDVSFPGGSGSSGDLNNKIIFNQGNVSIRSPSTTTMNFLVDSMPSRYKITRASTATLSLSRFPHPRFFVEDVSSVVFPIPEWSNGVPITFFPVCTFHMALGQDLLPETEIEDLCITSDKRKWYLPLVSKHEQRLIRLLLFHNVCLLSVILLMLVPNSRYFDTLRRTFRLIIFQTRIFNNFPTGALVRGQKWFSVQTLSIVPRVTQTFHWL